MWILFTQILLGFYLLRKLHAKTMELDGIHKFFQKSTLDLKTIFRVDEIDQDHQAFRDLLTSAVKSGIALKDKLLKLDTLLHQVYLDQKKLESKQKSLVIKYLLFSMLAVTVSLFINIKFFALNFQDLIWMGDDSLNSLFAFASLFIFYQTITISPELFPKQGENFLELQIFLENYFQISSKDTGRSSTIQSEIKKISRYSGESDQGNLENANLGYLQQKINSNQNRLARYEDTGAILEILLYAPSIMIILRLFYLLLDTNL